MQTATMVYFFQGAALAMSATIMPGPFQAFLLSKALQNGWKRTLPAAFAPLVTDGPMLINHVTLLPASMPPRVKQARILDKGKSVMDEDEIKRMISKELDSSLQKELKKALEEELAKALKSKDVKADIGEISKKVLKKLYKDLSLHHPYIIDRIKV